MPEFGISPEKQRTKLECFSDGCLIRSPVVIFFWMSAIGLILMGIDAYPTKTEAAKVILAYATCVATPIAMIYTGLLIFDSILDSRRQN